MDNLVPFFQSALLALGIGLAGLLVSLLVRFLLRKILARFLGRGWSNFLANLVMLGLLGWTVKIILDQAGAAGALVILATALTAMLAIGSERVAADLVGGVAMLFSKPYKDGDYIMVGNYEGVVRAISLMSTTLESSDGSHIILRNSGIVDNVIVNFSNVPAVRISVVIPVPVGADLAKAAETLEKSLETFAPQVRDDDHPATVLCEQIDEGYAEFQVRLFVPASEDYPGQRTRLLVHAAESLKKARIPLEA
jgi:small conductance mechanosensitive channel